MNKNTLRNILMGGGAAAALAAAGAFFALRPAHPAHEVGIAKVADGENAPGEARSHAAARRRQAAQGPALAAPGAPPPMKDSNVVGPITDVESLEAVQETMLEAHPELREDMEKMRLEIEENMQAMAEEQAEAARAADEGK